ncbi:PAB1 binding protein [Coemansia sp. RSA 1365]|nr:PAB1 binding protein [Coemansia sp. RSA 1365]
MSQDELASDQPANSVSAMESLPDFSSDGTETNNAAVHLEEASPEEDKTQVAVTNPTPAKGGVNAPKGNKNKRSRRASRNSKAIATATNPAVDADGEDINLHVEAGWSEEEKDDKEHPAKRVAANAGGSPAVTKRAAALLENFTIRAVVTRKDVDVVFGQDSDKKKELEKLTGANVTVVSGKDDPEIVVDRVLSINGHIDGVAAAYKHFIDGMLSIGRKAGSTTATGKESTEQGSTTAVAKEEIEPDVAAAADGDETAATVIPADATVTETTSDAAAVNPTSDEAATETAADAVATETADDAATEPDNKDETPAEGVTKEPSKDKPTSATKKATAASVPTVRATLRMLVPHKCVGSIMGHGGKTINSIRDSAKVSIHTSESTLPCSSERIVELVGTSPSIESALRMIAEALTKDITAYSSADYYVPAANLPSAMTVETQGRKRKDQRRQGHGDGHIGNRNQGNRSSGVRNNSNNGYTQNRGYIGHGGGNRSGFGGGTMNNGGNRNDRYNRQGNQNNNRQGGRSRGPGVMSNVNRMPVGMGGMQGYSNQYDASPDGYHGGHSGGMRPSGPAAAMGYGGYVVPAATAYPAYATQGAASNGMGNSGPQSTPYGSGISHATAAPPANMYGGGYGAAAGSYQFPAPAAYGYPASPMQNMYGTRPPQATTAVASAAHPSRPYGGYGNRQQPSMGMGAPGMSGAMGAASGDAISQTVQQIYVPGDKIGAVIGRRGESINEIRRTTSARVDIQDSAQGAKERLVVITGAYEQVRTAYNMIKSKIDMARPAGRQY